MHARLSALEGDISSSLTAAFALLGRLEEVGACAAGLLELLDACATGLYEMHYNHRILRGDCVRCWASQSTHSQYRNCF